MSGVSSEYQQRLNDLPNVERTLALVDLAYAEQDVKVLGWADSSVMAFGTAAGGSEDSKGITFSAFTDVQRSHEGEVLVIAIRVPHPDYMSLDEVVGCQFCGGSGYEWRDYWSQDAEPCRRGCTADFGSNQQEDQTA